MVPRVRAFPGLPFRGFRPFASDPDLSNALGRLREEGFFMERRYAEAHPEFKQPIPYVAVSRGETVLCLTRSRSQSEQRLHGLRSIGVGGHVNPCDEPRSPGEDLLLNACLRELHEELVLPRVALPLTPIGLLNDDSTEVGSVHLGVVYLLEAGSLPVAIRETAAMTGGFEPLAALQEEVRRDPAAFESWSVLLLESGALASAEAPAASLASTP